MGRKGHQIDEKIKDKLNTNSITELTYNELYDSVKTDYFKDLSTNKYKPSFIRHLNGFLNSGQIEVTGYVSDPTRQKEQKFVHDYILLKWSERKTRPDIQILLEKMDSNNNSYLEIKSLFKNKLKELNKFYKDRWDLVMEWTLCYSPTEIKNKLSGYEYYDEINNLILNLNEKEIDTFFESFYLVKSKVNATSPYPNVDELIELQEDVIKKKHKSDGFSSIDEMKKYKENFNNIVLLLTLANKWESHEENIFFIPIQLDEFNNVFFDINNKISSYDLSYGKKINPVIATWIVEKVPSFIDRESILHCKGYSETFHNIPDSNIVFEGIVDIIYTYPNEEQKILFNILAKGLSDEPGSIEIFAEFFEKMNSINYPERLDNILGIVSKDYKVK
jgi:hypothetical protein